METSVIIGNIVNKYRQINGLSITTLAELANSTRPYISDIERGKKTPSFDMFEKILNVLGMTIQDLFVCETFEWPPEMERLIQNAKQLHPDILKSINNMVENINSNYRMVNTDIRGIDTNYVVDLDKKPEGLSKEEELEAQNLIHRLKELEAKKR